MYSDDIDYASKRLNQTLVRLLDGTPFFIDRTAVDNGMMVHRGTDMVTDDSKYVLHTELDLEPVPLGFINSRESIAYVCRKPMRRDWKQGLSTNSIRIYGQMDISDLRFKLLNQPILNQYPTYKKALETVGRKHGIAFSRDFGLQNDGGTISLRYKMYKVGTIQGDEPVLDPAKFFLQQHLAEALGN